MSNKRIYDLTGGSVVIDGNNVFAIDKSGNTSALKITTQQLFDALNVLNTSTTTSTLSGAIFSDGVNIVSDDLVYSNGSGYLFAEMLALTSTISCDAGSITSSGSGQLNVDSLAVATSTTTDVITANTIQITNSGTFYADGTGVLITANGAFQVNGSGSITTCAGLVTTGNITGNDLSIAGSTFVVDNAGSITGCINANVSGNITCDTLTVDNVAFPSMNGLSDGNYQLTITSGVASWTAL